MKFVLSFSGGKDSVLALHRLIEDGHEPVALLVMYNTGMGRSWIHGIERQMLDAAADALGIPLLCCPSEGATYEADMERALMQAKEMGAEACGFGDIDIDAHRAWDESRCRAAGLTPLLPLWGRDRGENVREAVRLGYRCLIKCIQNGVLPEDFLGQPLSGTLLDDMARRGIDLCGENGEYHTVVVDGPLFRHPVPVVNRGIVRFERISCADLVLE